MPRGSSDDVTFHFYGLATIDELGQPHAEAHTDPEAIAPDGFLTKRWNAISENGIGVLPVEFEIKLNRQDLEVNYSKKLNVEIKQSTKTTEPEQNLIIDAKVEENKPSWDDKEDWEEDSKPLPSRFSDVEKDIEERKFDDVAFEETFGDNEVSGPFAKYIKKTGKQPTECETVLESLHSENSVPDEINLSVIGSDEEEN